MENKSNLSDLKYQDLAWRIVGAARRQARTISAFRESHDGCIRIEMVPLCRDADDWLGGMSGFESVLFGAHHDVCERQFIFKADVKGHHTVHRRNPDGSIGIIHTEVSTAAMAAYISRKTWLEYEHMRCNPSLHLSADPTAEGSGLSKREGAYCTIITLDGANFMALTISIFIGEPDEDMKCSLLGGLEAQEFFGHCSNRVKFCPFIDGKKFPLEQIWRV